MVKLRLLIVLFVALLPALVRPVMAEDTLRLVIPDMRPVVGEMIPVTIRGEYTGAISLSSITFPDSPAYDWIQVARDRWAQERVEGRLVGVFERRIAVFPRVSGSLTIGPVTHHLTKAEGMTRPTFDVVAGAVTLTVAPYPGAGRPLAARHFTVQDEFSKDPAELREGETLTRRITLTAEGTMAHLLPARPEIREPWLISFTAPEIRETRLTAEGPVAVAIWEWSMRPHTGEVGSLMPIQFPWFNTLIREMRGAVTLPVQIGLGGFGDNMAGAAAPPARFGLNAGLALAGGLILALLVALPGQRAGGWRQARRGLKARLPNPNLRALKAAAAGGDLAALRHAARDYAAHERAFGRAVDEGALADLDRAIYGPQAGGAQSAGAQSAGAQSAGDPAKGEGGMAFDRAAFLGRIMKRGS